MQITIEAHPEVLADFITIHKADEPWTASRLVADILADALRNGPTLERIEFGELIRKSMERTVVRFSHYGNDITEIVNEPLTVYSISILNLGASINVHSNSLGMGYGGPGISVYPGGWVEVLPL